MKTLKDSKGASIGVHDTVIVNGIVNARAVLSINLDNGTLEVVSADGHQITVSPDQCHITKKASDGEYKRFESRLHRVPAPVMPPAPREHPPLTDAYNKSIGIGDTVNVPSFGLMKQTVRSISYDAGNLDVGLAPCANTTVGPKDCVIVKKAGDVAMWPSHQVSGIPPAAPTAPTTALQPGERVEAINPILQYEECTTVGPHPDGTGQFVFVTDFGSLFISSKFRPVKTECDRTVEAAIAALRITEDMMSDTDYQGLFTDLFKAGYLSEPES
tara:strand:- start:6696 stop:7511 length:816 start_codon:yes stop_codon:yes gene_type:complete